MDMLGSIDKQSGESMSQSGSVACLTGRLVIVISCSSLNSVAVSASSRAGTAKIGYVHIVTRK